MQTNAVRRAIIGDMISSKGRYWKLGSGPDKISLTDIEAKIRETKRNVWRTVTQYDMKGTRIRTYDSITQASVATGIHNMNINSALKSEADRTAGGFLLVYKKGVQKIKISSALRRRRQLVELYIQPVTQYGLDG